MHQGNKNEYEYATKFEFPDERKVTLLAAARLRNDESFIRSIEHVHLGEKDFRKHSTCGQKYVKPTSIAHSQSAPEKDIYNSAKSIITQRILGRGECMSIDTLMEESCIDEKGADGRKKLKRWVDRNFSGEVIFLTPSNNERQIIVGRKLWEEVSSGAKTLSIAICSSGESIIKTAVALLRKIVEEYMSNSVELSWPPTVESL